jgi:predicted permease
MIINKTYNQKNGEHTYDVLINSFCKRAFGEDTGVVGRDVLLNGSRFQVIGVAREGFTGTTSGLSPDVFTPIIMYRTFNPASLSWNTRTHWFLIVMGRLKPGITRSQAESEHNTVWHQILQNDPNRKPVATWDANYKLNNTAVVQSGSQGWSFLRLQTSKPLTVLMITVGVVLLIACANVANLQLARGVTRRKEFAVRLAIGAGRARLIRQMLTESVLISVLGGVAGLAVAWIGVKVLVGFLPAAGSMPLVLNLSPDLRLFGFAFGLSLLSGLIAGLAPAFRSSRPDLVPALKADAANASSGRAAIWDLRRTLVATQVALSLLLLAGAGLFVRTLTNLKNLDPGMQRENLLFVGTIIGQLGYEPQRERVFHDRLREEVQRIPGVRAASTASITPQGGSRWNNWVQVEGYTWKPDEPPHVDMNAVTPRFFETAGIPIVLGRDFRDSDTLPVLPDRQKAPPPPGTEPPAIPGPPLVAIVNEAFVRKFLEGRTPLGARISMSRTWREDRVWEIVGVVRDARYFDLRKPVEPMIYQAAYRSGDANASTLSVRTTGDPTHLINAIRGRVRELEAAVSVTDTRTMEDNMNRTLMQERFVATLGGFFGVVALVLAAIGLYGVMSQSVTRRTREIGIRMALGAEARRVLWLVLRDAMTMVAAGVIVGAIATAGLTRYTESMLYGVQAQDPLTFAAAGAVLIAVTAIAGFLPAWRATRVEPMRALREE